MQKERLQIYEDSESNSQHSAAQPKHWKKIKKEQKKKKGRAKAMPKHQHISLIRQFVEHNSSLLNTSPPELAQMYRKKIASTYHVRQLLSNSNESVFNLKQADCQQETWKYLTFLRTIKQSVYQKFGIFGKTGGFSVSLLRREEEREGRIGSARQVHFLSSLEDYFYFQRENARRQVRQFIEQTARSMEYSQIQLKDIQLEILALAKMNNQLEETILKQISRVLARENVAWNWQSEQLTSVLLNQYIQELMKKNLERAFAQQQIDFYNYHKRIQNYENNDFIEADFQKIWDLAALKKYMGCKKPKANKFPRSHLRTPCSACFSDFSELSNPILKCPECPIRVHKHCQKVENRCHRCRFGRTANEEKSKTGFCYICQRPREKGLMILTVSNRSPHYFAHNFCLLIHNFWRIEDGEFKGEHVTTSESQQQCKICGKKSGIMLQCESCNEQMHGMCAYLEGMSFHMERRTDPTIPYKIQLNCCQDWMLRKRLSMQRKFKLNYEKVIFRENKELFDYIMESQMKPE